MISRFVIAALLLLTAAPALAEGRYSADRYDSRIEVLDGGTIRITETIAIRFESGTYRQFYRAVPVRMTDGIEILSAAMDGAALPAGDDPGHVQISGSSNVRVTWHFAPTSNSSHTFEVIYLARGVVRQEQDADVVAWRILPTEHRYQIATSTTDISLPTSPSSPPAIDGRRLGESSVDVDGTHVRIEARAIRSNGWLQASVHLPRGSLIDAPPAWQQHESDVSRSSRSWIAAASIVLVLGLALLFFVHQQYDTPPGDSSTIPVHTIPPDSSAPVIAGALVANGAPHFEHALAALFSLADRGELRIDEQSRLLGQRQFALAHVRTGRPLAPYEEQLLEIVFGTSDGNAIVSLGKARNRLMRQFRKFRAAFDPVMRSAGLIDEGREAVRRRFGRIGVSCLIGAGLSSLVLAFLVDTFGPWPMLIPLALVIVGVASLISAAAHTPLSNDGIRRARDWRGFRQHLRDVARDRGLSPGDVVIRQMLPFAVALGLAHAWSAYLKNHRAAAPEWFRAMGEAGNNSSVAFSAFVASGGHAAGNGGMHGGVGAAAGGGASGAS